MTDQSPDSSGSGDAEDPRVMVIGPDGMPMAIPAGASEEGDDDGDGERHITDLVEQPAKVMRIGSMIRQLLEEVKSAPLDEASRARLKEIHQSSIKELEQGLAPELIEELERLTLPFTDETPSESELRIAQAQFPSPSCGSRRRSWWAGSRVCSTASRPRSTHSRSQPVPSSSRCVAHCRRG
jgi:hypothetical protein